MYNLTLKSIPPTKMRFGITVPYRGMEGFANSPAE